MVGQIRISLISWAGCTSLRLELLCKAVLRAARIRHRCFQPWNTSCGGRRFVQTGLIPGDIHRLQNLILFRLSSNLESAPPSASRKQRFSFQASSGTACPMVYPVLQSIPRRPQHLFCFLNNLSELRILTTFYFDKDDHQLVYLKTIT